MLPHFTAPERNPRPQATGGAQTGRQLQSAPSSQQSGGSAPKLPAIHAPQSQTPRGTATTTAASAPKPPSRPGSGAGKPVAAAPPRRAFEERHEAKRDGLWDVRAQAIAMLLQQADMQKQEQPSSDGSTAAAAPQPPTSASQAYRRPVPKHLADTRSVTTAGVTPRPPLAADVPAVSGKTSKTKAVMRRLAKVTSTEQLAKEEEALRDLVASNESRHRNAITMQRMRDSLHRTERQTVTAAEACGRKVTVDAEQLAWDTLVARPLAIIVEETTARHAIESKAIPFTVDTRLAQMARTTGTHVLWRSTMAARRLDHDIEAIERAELLDRMYDESWAIAKRRQIFLQLRNAMQADLIHLQDEAMDRLTVENAELAARDAFEAVALERHLSIVLDAISEFRRIVWTDVQTLERISRENAADDEHAQWKRMVLAEETARRHAALVAVEARAARAERAQRQMISDDESAEWRDLSVTFLRQWTALWDALIMARGPHQELDKLEVHGRLDIEGDERRAFRDLTIAEVDERNKILNEYEWRRRLVDEDLDGRIALATMESDERVRLRAYFDSDLVKAIRKSSAQPVLDEHQQAELFARGELEFEAYQGYMGLFFEKELIECRLDEAGNRARIEAERDTTLNALEIHARNDANLLSLSSERGLRYRLRRLQETEEAARSEMSAAEAEGRSAIRNATYESMFAARDALDLAVRNASDAQVVEAAEARRRSLLVGMAVDDLYEMQFQARNEQEALARDVERRAEFVNRISLYLLVLEMAADIARYELEIDQDDAHTDMVEDELLAREVAERELWARTENDHRRIILDMRDGPLPANIWLGSLEGDENAIRENLVYEAEVDANAALQYLRFVMPEVLKPELQTEECGVFMVYHDDTQHIRDQATYFLGAKSLAERIGDVIEVLASSDEVEGRAAIEFAELQERDSLTATQAELIARRSLEEWEARQRTMAEEAKTRILRNLALHETVLLTKHLADDEMAQRTRLWLENRSALLTIAERRTKGARKLDKHAQMFNLDDEEAAAREPIVHDEDEARQQLVFAALEGAIALTETARTRDRRLHDRWLLLNGVEVAELPAWQCEQSKADDDDVSAGELIDAARRRLDAYPVVEFAPPSDIAARFTVREKQPQHPADDTTDDAAEPAPAPKNPTLEVVVEPRHTVDPDAEDARGQEQRLIAQQFHVIDDGEGYVKLVSRAFPASAAVLPESLTRSFELVAPSTSELESDEPTSPSSPGARARLSAAPLRQTFLHGVRARSIQLRHRHAANRGTAVGPSGAVEEVALPAASTSSSTASSSQTQPTAVLLIDAADATYAAQRDREVLRRRVVLDDVLAAAVDSHNASAVSEEAKIKDDEFVVRSTPFEFVCSNRNDARLTLQRRSDGSADRVVLRPKTAALLASQGAGAPAGDEGGADVTPAATPATVTPQQTPGAQSLTPARRSRRASEAMLEDAGWFIVTQSFYVRPATFGHAVLVAADDTGNDAIQISSVVKKQALAVAADDGRGPVQAMKLLENNATQHWEFRVEAEDEPAAAGDAPANEASPGGLLQQFAARFSVVPAARGTAAILAEDAAVGDVDAENGIDAAKFTLITAAQSDTRFAANSLRHKRLTAARRALVGVRPRHRVELVPVAVGAKKYSAKARVRQLAAGGFGLAERSGAPSEQYFVTVNSGTGLITIALGDNDAASNFDECTRVLGYDDGAITVLPMPSSSPSAADDDAATRQKAQWIMSDRPKGTFSLEPVAAVMDGSYLTPEGGVTDPVTEPDVKPEFRFVLQSVAAKAAADEALVAQRTADAEATLPSEEEVVELVPVGKHRERVESLNTAAGTGFVTQRATTLEALGRQRFRLLRRPNGAVRVECVATLALLQRPAADAVPGFVAPGAIESVVGLDWAVVPVAAEDAGEEGGLAADDKVFKLVSIDDEQEAAPLAFTITDGGQELTSPVDTFTVVAGAVADEVFRAEAELAERVRTGDLISKLAPLELVAGSSATVDYDRLQVDDAHSHELNVKAKPRAGDGTDAYSVQLLPSGFVRLLVASGPRRGYALTTPTKPGLVQCMIAPADADEEASHWEVALTQPSRAPQSPESSYDSLAVALLPRGRGELEVLSRNGVLVADDSAPEQRPMFVAVSKSTADNEATVAVARAQRFNACSKLLPDEDAIVELLPGDEPATSARRVRRLDEDAIESRRVFEVRQREGAAPEWYFIRRAVDGYIEIFAVDAGGAATGKLCSGENATSSLAFKAPEDIAATSTESHWSIIPAQSAVGATDSDSSSSQKRAVFSLRPRSMEESHTMTDSGLLSPATSLSHVTFSFRLKAECDAEAARAARNAVLGKLPIDAPVELAVAIDADVRRLVPKDPDFMDSTDVKDTPPMVSGRRAGTTRETFLIRRVGDEGFATITASTSPALDGQPCLLTAPLSTGDAAMLRPAIAHDDGRPAATHCQHWEVTLLPTPLNLKTPDGEPIDTRAAGRGVAVTLCPRSLPSSALTIDGLLLDRNPSDVERSALVVVRKSTADAAAEEEADRLRRMEIYGEFVEHALHGDDFCEVARMADDARLTLSSSSPSAAVAPTPSLSFSERTGDAAAQCFKVTPTTDGYFTLAVCAPSETDTDTEAAATTRLLVADVPDDVRMAIATQEVEADDPEQLRAAEWFASEGVDGSVLLTPRPYRLRCLAAAADALVPRSASAIRAGDTAAVRFVSRKAAVQEARGADNARFRLAGTAAMVEALDRAAASVVELCLLEVADGDSTSSAAKKKKSSSVVVTDSMPWKRLLAFESSQAVSTAPRDTDEAVRTWQVNAQVALADPDDSAQSLADQGWLTVDAVNVVDGAVTTVAGSLAYDADTKAVTIQSTDAAGTRWAAAAVGGGTGFQLIPEALFPTAVTVHSVDDIGRALLSDGSAGDASGAVAAATLVPVSAEACDVEAAHWQQRLARRAAVASLLDGVEFDDDGLSPALELHRANLTLQSPPVTGDDATSPSEQEAYRFGVRQGVPAEKFRLQQFPDGYVGLVRDVDGRMAESTPASEADEERDSKAPMVFQTSFLTPDDVPTSAKWAVVPGEATGDFTLVPAGQEAEDTSTDSPGCVSNLTWFLAAKAERAARRAARRGGRISACAAAAEFAAEPFEIAAADEPSSVLSSDPESGDGLNVAMAPRGSTRLRVNVRFVNREGQSVAAPSADDDATDTFAVFSVSDDDNTVLLAGASANDRRAVVLGIANPEADDFSSDSDVPDAPAEASVGCQWSLRLASADVGASSGAASRFILTPRARPRSHLSSGSGGLTSSTVNDPRSSAFVFVPCSVADAAELRVAKAKTCLPTSPCDFVHIDPSATAPELLARRLAPLRTADGNVIGSAPVGREATGRGTWQAAVQPSGFVTFEHQPTRKTLAAVGGRLELRAAPTNPKDVAPECEFIVAPDSDATPDPVTDLLPLTLTPRLTSDVVISAGGDLIEAFRNRSGEAAFYALPPEEAALRAGELADRLQRLQLAEKTLGVAVDTEAVVEIEPKPRRRRWKPDGTGGRFIAESDSAALAQRKAREGGDTERFTCTFDIDGFVQIVHAASNRRLVATADQAVEIADADGGSGASRWAFMVPSSAGTETETSEESGASPKGGRVMDGEVLLVSAGDADLGIGFDLALNHAAPGAATLVPLASAGREDCSLFVYDANEMDEVAAERAREAAEEDARRAAIDSACAERDGAIGFEDPDAAFELVPGSQSAQVRFAPASVPVERTESVPLVKCTAPHQPDRALFRCLRLDNGAAVLALVDSADPSKVSHAVAFVADASDDTSVRAVLEPLPEVMDNDNDLPARMQLRLLTDGVAAEEGDDSLPAETRRFALRPFATTPADEPRGMGFDGYLTTAPPRTIIAALPPVNDAEADERREAAASCLVPEARALELCIDGPGDDAERLVVGAHADGAVVGARPAAADAVALAHDVDADGFVTFRLADAAGESPAKVLCVSATDAVVTAAPDQAVADDQVWAVRLDPSAAEGGAAPRRFALTPRSMPKRSLGRDGRVCDDVQYCWCAVGSVDAQRRADAAAEDEAARKAAEDEEAARKAAEEEEAAREKAAEEEAALAQQHQQEQDNLTAEETSARDAILGEERTAADELQAAEHAELQAVIEKERDREAADEAERRADEDARASEAEKKLAEERRAVEDEEAAARDVIEDDEHKARGEALDDEATSRATAEEAEGAAKQRRSAERRRRRAVERYIGSLEEPEVLEIVPRPEAGGLDRGYRVTVEPLADDDADARSQVFCGLREHGATTQAFVFRDAADGYVSAHLFDTPDAVLSVADGRVSLSRLQKPSDDDGGVPIAESQRFIVQSFTDTVFGLRPATDAELILAFAVPAVDNDDDHNDDGLHEPATLQQFDPEADDATRTPWELGAVTKMDADADADAAAAALRLAEERRAQRVAIIERIAGDLSAMQTFEIVPSAADTFRWRYDADTQQAQVVEREHGYGDAHHFLLVDASDGYVSVVPWSKAEHSLALNNGLEEGAQAAFVDTDPADEQQMFELREVEGEANQFMLAPRQATDMVLEAALDGDGKLALVKELSTFCAFQLTAAMQSTASRPISRGTPRDQGREARVAAVSKILGDLSAMRIVELIPAAITDFALDVGTGDASAKIGVATRNASTRQQFVFTDLGEGYVSIVPVESPNSAVQLADDGKGFVVGDASDAPTQAFEVIPGQEDDIFSLCLKSNDTEFVESMLDAPEKLWRLVPEAEATNFCEFKISEPLTEEELSLRRTKSKRRGSRRSIDLTAIRIAALKDIFGEKVVDEESGQSEPVELHPAASDEFRITSADSAPAPVGPRAPKGKRQVFVAMHRGGGHVSIVDVGRGLALAVREDDTVGFEQHSEEPSDEQIFTVTLVPVPEGEEAPEKPTCTLIPRARSGMLVEAQLDQDEPTLRLVADADATNFCEFGAVLNSKMAAADSAVDRARAAKKRRKQRIATTLGVVSQEAMDEMEVFEIAAAALDTLRLQASGDGQAITVARRDGSDSQQVVFMDAGEGWVNLVTWGTSSSAFAVSEDGQQLAQEPLDAEADRFKFEFHAFDNGEFGLVPFRSEEELDSGSDNARIVEAPLDADEIGKTPVPLRLVSLAEASNFSAFKLEKPRDTLSTATPQAGTAAADPMIEVRNADLLKTFGERWDGRKVKVASGADEAKLLRNVDGKLLASDGTEGEAEITVHDATNGHFSLEIGSGSYISIEGNAGVIKSEPMALELVLLEGATGFCFSPADNPSVVFEIQIDQPAPHPTRVVEDTEISTFCELVIV